MKKTISVTHCCVISIIFLFFITVEAVAGTYIYDSEKGEAVSYSHKNGAQQSDTADTEAVESIDTGKILSRKNKDEQDIDLPDSSGTDSDTLEGDQNGKNSKHNNQKDNKKL